MPAELLSDSTVANVASSTGAQGGLPFEVILDDQTDARDEDAGEVGGADLPVDLRDPAVQAAVAAIETVSESLASLLIALEQGIQGLQVGRDDLKDSIAIASIGKDKPANEAAALLLLASQNLLKPIEVPQLAPASSDMDATSPETPKLQSVDDQLAEDLLVALAALQTAQTDDVPAGTGVSTAVDPESSAIDQLIKAAADRVPPDQLPMPDATPARRMPPAAPVATVDAIRLTVVGNTLTEMDNETNQSSTAAGFDRRNAKTGT